jgi:hypothetical protein
MNVAACRRCVRHAGRASHWCLRLVIVGNVVRGPVWLPVPRTMSRGRPGEAVTPGAAAPPVEPKPTSC